MTNPAPQDGERTAILDAVTVLASEAGSLAVPLDDVLERAGVDRAAFDRHFSSKEDCFVAAWNRANEEFRGRVLSAYEEGGSWRDGMRRLAYAMRDFLLEFRDEGRLLFLVDREAGPEVRARLEENMEAFVAIVDQGRLEMDDPESLSRSTAEGIAGAIFEQIAMAMRHRQGDALAARLPTFLFMTVRPYLGLDAALEELDDQED